MHIWMFSDKTICSTIDITGGTVYPRRWWNYCALPDSVGWFHSSSCSTDSELPCSKVGLLCIYVTDKCWNVNWEWTDQHDTNVGQEKPQSWQECIGYSVWALQCRAYGLADRMRIKCRTRVWNCLVFKPKNNWMMYLTQRLVLGVFTWYNIRVRSVCVLTMACCVLMLHIASILGFIIHSKYFPVSDWLKPQA